MAALAAIVAGACTMPDAPTLEGLEAALAANDSATAALEQWCAVHAIANPARIRAIRVASGTQPAPDSVRAALGLGDADPLGYRHVRLTCGGTVLSEAYNWYAPARLTGAMNDALDHTDTPFGKVIAPLRFTRERLASEHAAGVECPAGTVLTQRALLRAPGGAPLALLVECYTAATLGRGHSQ